MLAKLKHFLLLAFFLPFTVQAQSTIETIVSAAETLTSSLSAEHLDTLSYDLGDAVRANWSNLPAGALQFERNGIRMGDLSDEQRAAVFAFLTAALSEEGYAKVSQIVRADEILAQSSTRAERMGWTEDNYWLAFFGEPSRIETWGWQFGGHHLAINMTLKGNDMVLSPTLLAVEPASYSDGGQTYVPMQEHIDKALAVINALETDTQAQSIVNNRPDELYAGAGGDGVIPDLEGSVIGTWSDEQKTLVLELVREWVGLMPDDATQQELDSIAAEFDRTYFAWNGATDGSGSIYYRIQGPNLLIEFSTQGALGSDAGHYHSIYRNPNNEYGVTLQ
jgi:hypothetical protein